MSQLTIEIKILFTILIENDIFLILIVTIKILALVLFIT